MGATGPTGPTGPQGIQGPAGGNPRLVNGTGGSATGTTAFQFIGPTSDTIEIEDGCLGTMFVNFKLARVKCSYPFERASRSQTLEAINEH